MSFSEELALKITGDSQEAQAAVKALGDHLTTAFEDPQESLAGLGEKILSGLTNPLVLAGAAAGLTLGAVVAVTEHLSEMAEHAAETGDRIGDLSLKMNTSAESASTLSAAMTAAGGSLEGVGQMSAMLQKRIEDSASTVGPALKKLGLDIDDIRTMDPGQMILAISDAFRALPPGTNEAAIAMELFGRSGAANLPQLLKPLAELQEQSEQLGLTWSETDVKAAQEFEEQSNLLEAAIQRVKDRIGMEFLPVLDGLVEGLSHNYDLFQSLNTIVVVVAESMKAGVNVEFAMFKDILAALFSGSSAYGPMAMKIFEGMVPGLSAVMPLLSKFRGEFASLSDDFDKAVAAEKRVADQKALDDWYDATQRQTKALGELLNKTVDYKAQLAEAKAAVAALTAADKEQIDAALRKGVAAEKVDQGLHLVAGTTEEYKKEEQEATKATKERTKALDDFYKKIVIVAGSSKAMNEVMKASPNLVKDLVKPYQSLTDVMKKGGVSLSELEKLGGPNLVKALDVSVPASGLTDFTNLLADVSIGFTALGRTGNSAMNDIGRSIQSVFVGLKQYAQLQSILADQQWQKNQGNTAAASALGKQALGMELTGGVQGVGGAVDAIKTGNVGEGVSSAVSLGGTVAGMSTSLFGASAATAAALGAATMGIGAAVIGGIALYKKLTASAGRDLVEKFADSQGGFDALHKQLSQLGTDGEQLWVQLTQGVGKNNPQQAQAAIDAVTKALADQQKKISDLDSGYSDLEGTLVSLGATVPSGLKLVVDQLLRVGDTTDAQTGLDQLTGAVKTYQDQLAKADAFKTIEQEMQDVGLTADDMNGKFKQAADEESARDIAKQWADLAPYVNDVNVLADKFGEKLETMAKDSLDAGTAIPESMKPIMQSLIDQGKILDDNGNAITDIGKLNWEEDPLQKSLDGLNQTIDNLTHALEHMFDNFSGNAQSAASNAARALVDNIPTDIDVNIRPHINGAGGADLGDVPVADAPIRAVLRGGLVRVNPGDVVGMPHLTPGFGGVHFGDINIAPPAGMSDDEARRFVKRAAKQIGDEVQGRIARGQIAVAGGQVRRNVSAR